MTYWKFLAWGCSVAMVACTPIEQRIASDIEEVSTAVLARTGERPPAWQADPDQFDNAVHELLAQELTEAAAVKIALLNNHAVRASYEQVGIGRADLVQAGLIMNPVMSANALLFGTGTEIELGIAQSFLDLFYRPMAGRIAAHHLQAAKAQVSGALTQLIYGVRRTFVRVRMATEIHDLRLHIHDAAAAAHTLMKKLHDAGNVTDPQLSAEHAAWARARLDLAQTELELSEAREELNRMLGLFGEDTTRWRISGKLSRNPLAAIELDNAEARAVQASWNLAALRATIAAEAERIGLRSWQGWLDGGELGAMAMRETDGEWGVGPAASLALPIFNHGQAGVAATGAELRMHLHHQYQLGVEIRSAARVLRDRLVAMAQRTRFLEQEYLPLSVRRTREVMQYYNAMQTGAFSLLAAKQQEIEAHREYLETLAATWIARLYLEEILAGNLNTTALQQASSTTRSAGNGHTTQGH